MHQHGSSNHPQPHRPQTGLSLPIRLVLYVSHLGNDVHPISTPRRRRCFSRIW